MTEHTSIAIPENRPLTEAETALVKWLLEHGTARELLTRLDRARVVSRCSCGCASVDFSIDGKVAIEDPLMQKIRYLDKLIDELAKGKAMEKILR